jgi:hypothetical protein
MLRAECEMNVQLRERLRHSADLLFKVCGSSSPQMCVFSSAARGTRSRRRRDMAIIYPLSSGPAMLSEKPQTLKSRSVLLAHCSRSTCVSPYSKACVGARLPSPAVRKCSPHTAQPARSASLRSLRRLRARWPRWKSLHRQSIFQIRLPAACGPACRRPGG